MVRAPSTGGWATSNLVSSRIHLAFGMGWLMSPRGLLGMELSGWLNPEAQDQQQGRDPEGKARSWMAILILTLEVM